ncbi:MAG: dienelactone hydrolase family protein [Firmicutes bacterium]|nr:dienelactone hydrolase family protein [Bacillota bacterium]
MHIFEILTYILSIVFIWMIMSKKTIKVQYVLSLLFLTFLVLILHFVFENTRWQLFTLYVVVLSLEMIVYLQSIMHITIRNFIKRMTIIVLSLLISISLITTFVFPLYQLPTPGGQYSIGTESFVIEDQNRYELYGDDSNLYRKFKIQMWYPSDDTDGYERAPWIEDGIDVARALSMDTGLPYFVLDHTVQIKSNSFLEAPISYALDQYPVIVISHGWRGFRDLHTDFAEELASFGYIVVSIDHTYGSVATVFSDDDVAYLNLDALPQREATPNFLDYANQLVYTYAGDITATLDYLEVINDGGSSSRFSEKLDLDTIGLLGHSTGGGADVAVAINDDRIDAVIGLDAWVEPIGETEIDKGLSMPSLFLRSGAWEIGENNTNLYGLIENSSYASLLYQIDGITHYDFAMVYMYSPLIKMIGFSGSVNSEYLTSILKSMITDFFNETLKNDTSHVIDSNRWDEVRVIIPE